MPLTLEPVLVASEEAGEGRLVFIDSWLVAVLVKLSQMHGREAGTWFLEAGFGPLAALDHPSFESLEAAERWLRGVLCDWRPSPSPGP